MTNSRSVAHSDVYISSWVEPLHHFLREILEEFDIVGAIAKKFGPIPWNPHVLEGDTSDQPSTADSGIFNRNSYFAVTACNHRYVSLLHIVHGSTCLKQKYICAMENSLRRLLKEDGL